MKIMVFLHGTVLMHRNAAGRSREARVAQVIHGDESIYDFAGYIPIGQAPAKLRAWSQGGAQIVYLSSHRDAGEVALDRTLLRKHGFPEGPVYFRRGGEGYHEVAERVLPDILVEDDCESIGGEVEQTYPRIRLTLKAQVKRILVQEFGGIDHLPDDVKALLEW
jgi:hypothetical protein